MNASVGAQLGQLGWTWTPTHAIVHLRTQGQTYRVAVPIQRVQNEFATELQAVGCPLPRAVGACSTVGFFKAISRAVKSAGRGIARGVKKLVPKAVRRAASKVVKVAGKAVNSVRKFARTAVRSKLLKAGLAAASFIPGAAAVTVPTLAAFEAADRLDRNIARGEQAARAISKGFASPRARAQKAQGLNSLRGIHRLRAQARKGNPAAARVLAALQRKYRG